MIFLLIFVYSGCLIFLALNFDKFWVYFFLVIIINTFALLGCGNYLLRAIIFPYSNYFIRKKLDSSLNQKFSQEFAKLLLQMLKNVKLMANLPCTDPKKGSTPVKK